MAKRRDIKGGVYVRGDSANLWIAYYDAQGKRQSVSADTFDPVVAEERWRALDAAAKAEAKLFAQSGGKPTGPVTVARYLPIWEAARKLRKGKNGQPIKSAAKDAARIRDHALPFIGHLALAAVEHEDLVGMVRALLEKTDEDGEPLLSPKTARHVYDAVRVMFADAIVDRLVKGTPCTLRELRGELPSALPSPNKMRSAVFTPSEAGALISSPLIPLRRRVEYGVRALGGPRSGEVADLAVSDYDRTTEPLGRLLIDSSWDFELLKSCQTKSGAYREVPVHPYAARLLAEWLASGWEADQGRKPMPNDLLFPAPASSRFRERRGNHFSTQEALELFHGDLDALGFRQRRLHDLRRTFVTLARRKAPKEHVAWITHAPPTAVIDGYTSPEFETMCAVVAKIEVPVRGDGDVVQLFAAKRG